MARSPEAMMLPIGRISCVHLYRATLDLLRCRAEVNPLRAKADAEWYLRMRNKALRISSSAHALAVSRTQARAALSFLKELR